jgi:hypothetical protein
MSSFSYLDTQKVLRLLHVSIMSPKEARRTFLTTSALQEQAKIVVYVLK